MATKYIWITMFLLSVCPEVDAAPLDKMIDSANEGNVQAQTQLGVIYATENGSGAHLEEAKKWLIKAAHGGSVEAEYNLGVIYSDSEKILWIILRPIIGLNRRQTRVIEMHNII